MAIKPTTQIPDDSYYSDVTQENFDMKNKPINRGPSVNKKAVRLTSKAPVTETQDFTSKSYYEEDDLM